MPFDPSGTGARPNRLSGVRIAFVMPGFLLSGAERQALLLAFELKKSGADILMIGFGRERDFSNPRLPTLCAEHGIPWYGFPLYGSKGGKVRQLIDLVRLAVFLRRKHVQILLPYTLGPNVLCGLVQPFSGARFCIWNQRDEGRGSINRRFMRKAASNTAVFISNSLEGRDFLLRDLGVEESKIHLVHNGVTLSTPRKNKKAWRKELGLSDDILCACMVAKLVKVYKDHDTLIRAWRKVVDAQAPQARPHLLLAGAFQNATESLRELTHELGLEKEVHFLGEVSDIPGLLASVDIGVFSSVKEGVPNGVLECMAMGLPVCGTDCIGIREAAGEHNAPYQAPPHDAEKLADAILLLSDDADLRTTVGQANKKRIEEEFSVQQLCGKTIEILVTCMKSRESIN